MLFYSSNGLPESSDKAMRLLSDNIDTILDELGLPVFAYDVKQRNALEITNKYGIHTFPTIAVINRGTNNRSNTLSHLSNGFTVYNLQKTLEEAGYKVELTDGQTEAEKSNENTSTDKKSKNKKGGSKK